MLLEFRLQQRESLARQPSMPAPIGGCSCALRKAHGQAAVASGICPVESAGWGFLLHRERVAGGMVPKYLVERIEAILRGSPMPARRSEREQVQGRLVRAR